ncbi:hypothetical protein [Ruminococcus flavefaciens]|uniref:hypothetical protein n=1 Tax=Ruminococcus flavefaciens TaxID=1265 RepID=UPI000492053E|nr:hypothetical protein [Ruminococcus flavefaciens]
MLKTLWISFKLKNTYRVNSILHAFRQIPLVKKLFPPDVYSMAGFKVFAYVISILWAFFSMFAFKIAYLFFCVVIWCGMFEISRADTPRFFMHLLVPLTILGAFINNYMFTPEKHKYYAMIQLGMEAKKYTLVNYFFSILRHFIGFAAAALLFGLDHGMKAWHCLLLAVFGVCAKTAVCPLEMLRFKKGKKLATKVKLNVASLILGVVGIVGLYAIAVFGYMIPLYVSYGIIAAFIVGAVIALPYIIRFKDYRALNKEILNAEFVSQMDIKAAQRQNFRKNTQKNISADTGITSDKSGFEYLNELFVKRHKKILWGSSVKITVVLALLLTVMCAVCIFMPKEAAELNNLISRSLPYFVFVMYAVNRGMQFTQALFVNCDHSLLTYPFYKQPKSILTLFRIRLREIIKVNLLPAAVGGIGLALLLFISGGSDNPVTYGVIFVSMCALSIFFSVHYLTIYYLLQPYNAGTEVKNGTYRIITTVTYLVCYWMIYVKVPALLFGVLTIVFCVLYIAAACLLVYKFAPKTFRIHS